MIKWKIHFPPSAQIGDEKFWIKCLRWTACINNETGLLFPGGFEWGPKPSHLPEGKKGTFFSREITQFRTLIPPSKDSNLILSVCLGAACLLALGVILGRVQFFSPAKASIFTQLIHNSFNQTRFYHRVIYSKVENREGAILLSDNQPTIFISQSILSHIIF